MNNFKEELKEHYIYRHIRLDTNKVFYIGIGIKNRYKQKGNRRNEYWKEVVLKTDYETQILKSNMSKEEACELEKIIISYYGLNNLTNLSGGGQSGGYGISPSKETREKIRQKHKGRVFSKDTKLKMSNAKKGMYFLNTNPNSKKVINIKTNVIFNTLKEASLSINKNYGSFKWSIKNAKNFEFKYCN